MRVAKVKKAASELLLDEIRSQKLSYLLANHMSAIIL